ncbi:MAG: MAPEG family protein [Rhizobiaceae bacterium]
MQSSLILWPMVILALATLYLYIPMSKARVKSVKDGKVKAAVYRLNQGEPEESMLFNRAIANQYESPTLFYAVCLAAYVSSNASMTMIVLAWAYALSKIAHSYVHTSSNKLRHRRPIFMASFLVLILLWVVLALHLAEIF